MSWFSSLTKLQIAVAIAVVLDVVVTVMLFVYGVIADPNFISNDVKHYSFYTSLLDVVAFSIARALVVGIVYIFGRATNLTPLLLIAWCSSIILIGKETLYFVEHSLDNVLITPLHYVLAGYCTLMGWTVLGLAKITRDSDDTDVTTLPPTSLRFKMYDEEDGTAREPTLSRSSLNRPAERSSLLGINSDSPIVVEVQPSPARYDTFLNTHEESSVLAKRLRRDFGAASGSPETNVAGAIRSASSDDAPPFKTSVTVMPSIPRLLMLHPQTGVGLKDRKKMFTTYKKCFVGKEAVDWLLCTLKSASVDRHHATSILETVMDKGYFAPVTNTRLFKDSSDHFYAFSDMNNLPVSYLDSADSASTRPPAREASATASTPQESMFEWPIEIDQLIRDMRDERDGVPIRDRRLTNAYTKTTQLHPRCFLGGEAVEWLTTRARRLPRAEDARQVMNVLLSGNVIYDISALDTGLPFSEKRFYRFKDDTHDQPVGAHQRNRLDIAEVVGVVSKLVVHSSHSPPPASVSPAGVLGNGSAPVAGAESEEYSSSTPTSSLSLSAPAHAVSVPKPIIRDSQRAPHSSNDGLITKSPSPSLRNFVDEMKQAGSGVPLKLRKNKVTREKVMSFTGRDGVDWMVKAKKLTEREHGVRILQRLLRAGVIAWVPRQASQRPPSISFGDEGAPYFDTEKDVYYFPEELKQTTTTLTGSHPARPSTVVIDSPSNFPSAFTQSLSSTIASPSSQSSSPSLSRVSSKRGLGPLLSNFVTEMKDAKLGISMTDHKLMISATESVTYHNCFPGSAAVDWITHKMGLVDRGHGTKILQKLVDSGVILSVIPQGTVHVAFFDDELHLYRFTNDV